MTPGFAQFHALLTGWLKTTGLFPDRNLHIDLILNPHAGTLKSNRRRKAIVAEFQKVSHRLPPPPLWSDRVVKVSSWITEYPGHEMAILAHLHAADPIGPRDQRLVVIAGGDGTSRGALICALGLPLDLLEGIVFFRLPLGTGNDACDARSWPEALELLSGRGPALPKVQPLGLLELRIPGHAIQFSFNIASVGLDAFVVHLTNRFKAWFPGNSYSLMVDLAAFFYEAFVQVVPARIEVARAGVPVLVRHEAFLLAAFGVSGHRTYGAGKKVLPDADNFCLAGKKNLFTKLAYRKPFYQGTHRGLSGITLVAGDELVLESPTRVPLQMDGEVLWLDPQNFPLTMKIVDRGLKVLALAVEDRRL